MWGKKNNKSGKGDGDKPTPRPVPTSEPMPQDYEPGIEGFKQYALDSAAWEIAQGNDIGFRVEDLTGEVIQQSMQAAADLLGIDLNEFDPTALRPLNLKGATPKVEFPGVASVQPPRKAPFDEIADIIRRIMKNLAGEIQSLAGQRGAAARTEHLAKQMRDSVPEDAGDGKREFIEQVAQVTEIVGKLIDPDITTPEELNALMNSLTNEYLAYNCTPGGHGFTSHEDHDPAVCPMARHHRDGTNPYRIVYKRIRSDDPTIDNKIEGLPEVDLMFLDSDDNSLNVIGFCLHPALIDPMRESLVSQVMSNVDKIGEQIAEAMKSLTEEEVRDLYEKDWSQDPALPEAARQHFQNGDAQFGFSVQPGMFCPPIDTLEELASTISSTFNTDAGEVFADLQPEDFGK